MLRDHEYNGERNRLIYVLKSRGMAHTNQVREFRLTDHGIDLIDVYTGQGNVLTGTARLAQEVRDRDEARAREEELARRKHEHMRKGQLLRAQIAALQMQLDTEEADRRRTETEEDDWHRARAEARTDMERMRRSDETPGNSETGLLARSGAE